ncbi:hypothetical protein [Thioalkalivibrio thiocyanodenitrificans]|uniref:hypothetical protein n=1 Tax=Thioalkalivibrio thiocyanodenitrificans TaxID=243063 RepID=UPI00037597E0|nr:hypothetical protein [Thioalkalivibrio thiocyanodenitrificans]
MTRFRYPLFSTLALAMAAGPAMAGPEYYWRLSLSQEYSRGATFSDRSCEPPGGVAAYFGCVRGQDGRPIGARGDFGTSLGGELAIGMGPVEGWRVELVVGHQPRFGFSGNANFLDSGDHQPVRGNVSHTRAGLKAYLDIAAMGGRDFGVFEPYLGAGLGVARNRIGTMVYEFPALPAQPALTVVPGDRSIGPAWMATLGTGVRLSSDSLVDVGLTYSDHGRVTTAHDEIDVVRGGDPVARVGVGETRARLRAWGLMIGLRHHFR